LPEIIQKARPSYRKYIIPRRHEFLYYY